MSELSSIDYNGGFNTAPAQNKQIGKIEQASHTQTTAADASGTFLTQVTFNGEVADLYAVLRNLPASGESMQIDVLKNGVSILLAAVTISSTATSKIINLYKDIDPTKRFFSAGDVFTVTRDYTAGGGPTPIGVNTVIIEPSKGSIRLR